MCVCVCVRVRVWVSGCLCLCARMRARVRARARAYHTLTRTHTHKFATSSAYKDHKVAVETLVANIDFQQWLYGSCDEKNLIIKELTRDDGTKYRPEPLVWRYRWDSKLGKPVVHYKPDLRVGGSFNQSKWGPWKEEMVRHEDQETGTMVARRVLRTVEGGVSFMLDSNLPDVRTNPGF